MPKKKPPLKITPLGGLDGIGKNMTAFEYGNDMVLVDAGLMFPDDDQPGIDLVLPDYTYLLENEHKLRGIVITHGHEDHTGALPYLLRDLTRRVPIYASRMTLGLIEGKLNEHKLQNEKLIEVQSGNLYTIAKDDDGWFWSYDRGNNLVDKEAGFSSPEDALQDLSIGKGKYVANVVLDEGRWASRQDMDQP